MISHVLLTGIETPGEKCTKGTSVHHRPIDLKIFANFIPRDEEREQNTLAIIIHSSQKRWETDNYSMFSSDLLHNRVQNIITDILDCCIIC